jgi:hypothetical protein
VWFHISTHKLSCKYRINGNKLGLTVCVVGDGYRMKRRKGKKHTADDGEDSPTFYKTSENKGWNVDFAVI